MANLDNLNRRLSKLEERDANRQLCWRTLDGRRVTYSAIDLYGGYMDLCALLYERLERPEEEPAPFSGVLAALDEAQDGERERIARHVGWLRSWDWFMQELHSPSPEMLEEV